MRVGSGLSQRSLEEDWKKKLKSAGSPKSLDDDDELLMTRPGERQQADTEFLQSVTVYQ